MTYSDCHLPSFVFKFLLGGLINVSLLAEVSFLFAFVGLTIDGRRHLCRGSKLNMLSTRGGYLATESSRDTSCCVDSLNNSGITVMQCARHSGLKSQSTNMSWSMRFEEVVDGGWIKVSFDPWQRCLLLYSSTQRTQNKRDLC